MLIGLVYFTKIKAIQPFIQIYTLFSRKQTYMNAFIRFSRPHTIIGTVLSTWCLWKMSASAHISWLLIALMAALCANIYIVGLNQLTDVDIDKQNKPELPLASGEIHITSAKWIVILCGLTSLILGFWGGKWLFITILTSLLIGTAYSLPPIRLKRFHITAALSILLVRGIVVHLGFYLSFGGEMPFPPILIALTAFMLLFSVVIAWFKDLPDMQGDKAFGIKTLALQLGQKSVLNICVLILAIGYMGLIFYLYPSHKSLATIHFFPLLVLIGYRMRLKMEQIAIKKFYLFIWGLFYLEYLLFSGIWI